jgi:hypothetical protein
MSYTYTYATLAVSQSTYDEVKARLRDAGSDDAIHGDEEGCPIDMHGLALVVEAAEDLTVPSDRRPGEPATTLPVE